jgi:hypothetical protein
LGRRGPRLPVLSDSPRRRNQQIINQLYTQALQMGLPQEIAVRILNIGQRPSTASACGNPSFGPAPAGPPSHNTNPYHTSTQPPPSNNPAYQQFAAQQMVNQYGHYGNPEYMASAPQQGMVEGGSYYADPNQQSQAMVQYNPNPPMEPIYGAGYSQNYGYENNPQLQAIPETTQSNYQYATNTEHGQGRIYGATQGAGDGRIYGAETDATQGHIYGAMPEPHQGHMYGQGPGHYY